MTDGGPAEKPPEAATRTLAEAATALELAGELYVAPTSYDFSRNPALLDRIVAGPHGYFRFINGPFSRVVCQRWVHGGVPPVNLHGDAHLEQYAVTELGRGLTDFDDSTKGPAVLDLLRFGVSLALALRTHAPGLACQPFYERFLEGYRAALEDPSVEAPKPAWVEVIRSRFVEDRAAYFAWIRTIMRPIPEERQAALEGSLGDYVKAMLAKHPELEPRFFEVQTIGALEMGIGSALDEKYLIRVRGPSEDPFDDVVLEAKEVRSLAGIGCVESGGATDPFRILLAQSRLAYRPYAYLGYIDVDGRKFWIHSWVDNYRELELDALTQEPEALMQVVYDVGVQLGRGHPKIAGEFELQLRQALIRHFDGHRDVLHEAVEDLADGVVGAWLRFKTALPPSSSEGRDRVGDTPERGELLREAPGWTSTSSR